MEIYCIEVAGHLEDRWSDYFDGLALVRRPDGVTVLEGALADQGALFGVLLRIRDLNVTLLAVRRLPARDADDAVASAEG